MKRAFYLLPILLLLLSFPCTARADSARNMTTECTVTGSIAISPITDNSLSTYSTGENIEISVKAPEPIGGIYLRFRTAPTVGRAGDIEISAHGFLAEFIDLSDKPTAEITVKYEKAQICDLAVYSAGEPPKELQRWQSPGADTDLLLLATHSDDDQLFFAGLLPLYARNPDLNVRVAYFVSHHDAPSRLHELLSGLWECGVTDYPEIGIIPDAYSTTLDGAIANAKAGGFTYEAVRDYQRYLLEKYRPLVVVLHDLSGEYGHGQHILNTQSFLDTLNASADGSFTPQKVYIHLYSDNRITLPIDDPLPEFGGLTAFQVSQKAFGYHKSQHWTWFKGWLYGKNGQITSSKQITAYNPAIYGLYSTSVGSDTANDMLENITPYAEIKRAQEEQKRLEEEKKLREEQERLAAEQRQKEAEEQARNQAERLAAEKKKQTLTFFSVLAASAFIALLLFIILKTKKRRK